jgi:hypothetical protein
MSSGVLKQTYRYSEGTKRVKFEDPERTVLAQLYQCAKCKWTFPNNPDALQPIPSQAQELTEYQSYVEQNSEVCSACVDDIKEAHIVREVSDTDMESDEDPAVLASVELQRQFNVQDAVVEQEIEKARQNKIQQWPPSSRRRRRVSHCS